MPLFRRLPAVFWFWCGVLSAGAAPLSLPPIDGSFSGDYAPSDAADAPQVHWSLEIRRASGGMRLAVISLEGTGTKFQAEVELDPSGQGTWKIVAGEFDAATLLALAGTALPEAARALTIGGHVALSGAGGLKDGRPTGAVRLTLSEGRVQNVTDGWTLEGVALRGEFAFDAAAGTLWSTEPGELTIATITTGRFGARNLAAHARLGADRTLALEQAGIEIAGGSLTVAPARIPLQPLVADLDLTLGRIGLQDVAALVPGTVADARGRIDGTVRVHWSEADGLRLGAGRLQLRNDEPAQVRLSPSPGLISGSLPSAVLKYYPGLGEIETGRIPIAADVLEVTFTPEGDAEGRTAMIRLAGGPADPSLRAPIDLTINVRGPLDSLIKFSTSQQLHLGGNR